METPAVATSAIQSKSIDMDSPLPPCNNELRSRLRDSLTKRRPTLTEREAAFLQTIIDAGDEFEVEAAYETLVGQKIFFEKSGGSSSGSVTRSLISADFVQNDGELHKSAHSVRDQGLELGSERRKELLKKRRESSVFGQIWQAHENGVAVGPPSSSRRPSLKMRGQSFRQLDSSITHRVEEIFRARRRSSTEGRRASTSSGRASLNNYRASSISNLRASFLIDPTAESLVDKRRNKKPNLSSSYRESPLSPSRRQATRQRPENDFTRSCSDIRKHVTFMDGPALSGPERVSFHCRRRGADGKGDQDSAEIRVFEFSRYFCHERGLTR
eukprot:scaffold108_cov162-Amphora_coffeaeformis.AAC.8